MRGCRFAMVSSTATFHWLKRITMSRTISPEIVIPADFHLIGSCLRPLEPILCAGPVTRFGRAPCTSPHLPLVNRAGRGSLAPSNK